MKHFAACLALVSTTATMATTGALPSDMRRCMAEQLKQRPFSGIVTAGIANQHFEQVSGFADAQSSVAISRETPFRLASVGKLFTQVAIGMLVDAGKLRLEDSVQRHLPELPETFAAISISQLLEHRSGVAPMTRPNIADAPVMAAAKTARDLVSLIAAKPLSFPPGGQEQYSNGGYLLLGAVIEAASGESYRSYVERQLFAALKMKSSSFEPASNAAIPLTRMSAPGQPPAATPQPRMEFPEFKASSAGDALSSAADMETFAKALIGDQLLKASTRATVFPRRSQPWRIGQAGGAVGSNTVFWVLPERNSWLIVLSNFDPPAGELMGQAVNPLLLGEACKTQAPGAMPIQRTGD
jgi:D-alanyl-D-alanine carboxypeptidase